MFDIERPYTSGRGGRGRLGERQTHIQERKQEKPLEVQTDSLLNFRPKSSSTASENGGFPGENLPVWGERKLAVKGEGKANNVPALPQLERSKIGSLITPGARHHKTGRKSGKKKWGRFRFIGVKGNK